MLKMRSEPNKWGLTARFSRFFDYFGAFLTLRAGKQPEQDVSNKGLHLTAHNWPSPALWDINYALRFDPSMMCAADEP